MSNNVAGDTVAVIGAAGHVGLGLCLVLADAGYTVHGIDINSSAIEAISAGRMPFLEEDGEIYLARALASGRLHFTSTYSDISQADTVIIVLGTPIDENLNPRFDILSRLLTDIRPYLHADQLLVLRSTLAPGSTQRVRALLEHSGLGRCGQDFYLVFAPERVLQGHSIAELKQLPQVVGAFEPQSYQRAETFFQRYAAAGCVPTTPVEAEIGKLITNMARYVNFAFANEVYLIAEQWGANANRIIDAMNYAYPRLALPTPGPNVGGPCLYKDGYFLLERIAFPDLISTAFKINEGMVAQITMRIERLPNVKKVAILGMTFKANSDDIRNSLAFKLKKQLDDGVYEIVMVDPWVQGHTDLAAVKHADCVVLMTPHQAFHDLATLMDNVDHDQCHVIDIWGFWSIMRYVSNNGVFTVGEARALSASKVAEGIE